MNQPPARLPDRTAEQRGLSPETQKILAEIEDVYCETPTAIRDNTPNPAVGSAPPVPQAGRPPMSAQATGASVMLIAGGFFSLCLGAAVSLVLHYSASADPVVVGLVVAAPPVAFLSLRCLMRAIKQASVPEEHHHLYTGPVHQEQTNTTNNNRWWGRSSTRT